MLPPPYAPRILPRVVGAYSPGPRPKAVSALGPRSATALQDAERKACWYRRAMKDHRTIDCRSLALHRLEAGKLRADSRLLDLALGNLVRWEPTASTAVRPVLARRREEAGFWLHPEFEAEVLRLAGEA